MFMSPSVRRFSWSLSINLNIVWSIAISALPIYYPLVFQHFNYSVSCYVFPFLRIFKTCYISKSFPSHRFYSRILYICLWPLYFIISQIFGTSGFTLTSTESLFHLSSCEPPYSQEGGGFAFISILWHCIRLYYYIFNYMCSVLIMRCFAYYAKPFSLFWIII